ncbi:clan AA aspartic protease [Baaleninema sp.]|uniref:clan AA aspartic protease n=1 Tax=Baaleninema sp. TaxID=3101197 RepID=UPI003D0781E8
MMLGFVNENREAIVRIAVGGLDSPKQMVDAVIDTGFTGFLSLPLSTIRAINLPWSFRDYGTLADGSDVIFDMYLATVIWNGQSKIVDVAASESDPLVGMSLLYGCNVQIDVVEGGTVRIESLS